MGFREWFLTPVLNGQARQANAITQKNIERMLIQMGAREDAADARFAELVELVRAGSVAKDAEITALRAALADADAATQTRVEEALAADSEFDADKKEAGNTALESLVAMPAPEPAPVDPSDPEAPVE